MINTLSCLLTSSLSALFSLVLVPQVDAADEGAVRSSMLVTTDWLAAHLHDPGVIVLCIASSREYYPTGHIPGARRIALSDITTTRGDVLNDLPAIERLEKVFRDAGVTKDSRIILYGERYNLLAARAYYTLDYLGMAENAALLDGGLRKWKNELRPMSKDAPTITSAALTARVNAQIWVDTQFMRTHYASRASDRAILLDARPAPEYSGARHSEEIHKLGHIPGAKNLYWMDLIVSREDPVILPPKSLQRRFAEAGVVPGAKLITYCRSGMQASFDYFIARYLGFDARMYGASFFEWSMEDLPSEISSQAQIK